jgi:hypothetical protein
MSPASALFRRALGDSRVRTLSFALLFAFATVTQATTYRSTYPTLAERMELARTFGDNQGTRLLYGMPHDLLTTGGWMSWRLGFLPGARNSSWPASSGAARRFWPRSARSAWGPRSSGSPYSSERCPGM